LEYDHYQMDILVVLGGLGKKHELLINCPKKELAENTCSASCTNFNATSSLFFHIYEQSRFKKIIQDYQSIDGRIIPITIYSQANPKSFMNKALTVLAELENDYGPWPHEHLLVYGAGSGG